MMIDKEGNIKVIDFGFAKILAPQNQFRTTTNCGTMGYTAPEVLRGNGYSFQVDIWGYGILLCELIQGSLPYTDTEDPILIQEQCIKGDLKLPSNIDHSTRDLLCSIFNPEPNLRITIKDIMKSPFFKDYDWDKLRNKVIDPKDVPYKPNPGKYRYILSNSYEDTCSGTVPESRPGTEQRTRSGAGDYDAPGSAKSPRKKLLGDYTVYKVNKEFDNF